MGYQQLRISIEVLENGFKVELPDLSEIKQKQKDAKKAKQPEPYTGDCTESFVATDVRDVVRMVSDFLKALPNEYDDAFDEATKK